MSEFCAAYEGGFWQIYEPSNGYKGQMSPDAAGIMVCLFTFSLLSFEYPGEPVFSRHFYRLRDYALGHAESTQIFAAID